MGWITHRNNLITISVIAAVTLFGLGESFGLGLNDNLLNSGITPAMLLGAAMIYQAVALWKKYI